jgi:surfactin synthase thioesterase subunit
MTHHQVSKSDPARWMLRSVSPDATEVLFCFPYSGVGASSYWRWPRVVSGMHIVPLQPPGRENRRREQRPRTHRQFAASLIEALSSLDGVPFAFFGHCGAVPYMLETTFMLQAAGAPLASWIMASSWGAPQNGLYGPLNFVELQTYDFTADVTAMAAKAGMTLAPEMVDAAAELSRFDIAVQRDYEYPGGSRIPVPVSVVGWSDDDVVPPETALAHWEEVATVRYSLLAGAHNSYLECPAPLQELMAEIRELWAVGSGLTPLSRRRDKSK